MSLDLNNPLLARALITLAIAVSGLALYAALNRLLLSRAGRAVENSGPAGLGLTLTGKPTVVYFTTPDCAPCKTVQRPALRRLEDQMPGMLDVIEIDASARPDLASRWGVVSVPTTFIVDAQGQLRHVNHGVTRAEKLRRQIEETVN